VERRRIGNISQGEEGALILGFEEEACGCLRELG
jgi:hypothetical protein